MAKAIIEKSTFKFLKDLKKNNNRDWFNKNKAKYQEAHDNYKAFAEAVEVEMNKSDVIEKLKHFRIYRDVRFSKDKTPYNTHFSSSLSRAGKNRRGGYFLRISTEGNFIVGGFWKPEPKDMKLIRENIAADSKPLKKVLASKKWKDNFGELFGEQVKSAPKGYAKDHPNIDLLKYKQFLAHKKVTEKMASSDAFLKEVVNSFKAMRPFFDYMTDVLTHDLNGKPLYK